MEDRIIILALENAIKFNGKANPGAIVGKIIQEFPDAKKDMKNTMALINEKAKDINELNLEEQEIMLKELSPESFNKEKKEHVVNLFGFMKIPEGTKVRSAFPPGIEKYPHIGHAKACLVNYLLAKEYDGEFILRFEDTNPNLVKKEYYDIMEQDLKWLGVDWAEIHCASDYMDDYYKYAEELISKGRAYMCSCTPEVTSENRKKGIACDCREKSIEANLEEWKNFANIDEGISVLRLKIDMEHKNSTMRDPAVFRLNKTPHARHGDKYKVWPGYDFQTAIADGLNKVNYRIRSKEFEMRRELQQWIQNECGFPKTNYFEIARFNMKGVLSSGRVIRDGIEKGELVGWDDPTLTTIAALRRRGFQPEAIKNFVVSTGMTKSESTMTWDDMIMHNKRLLDKEANRYFFVRDPVKVTIKDAPVKEVELRLNPEDLDKGFRKFETSEEYYLSKEDIEGLEDGDLVRLIDGFNFRKEDDGFVFDSHEFEKFRGKGKKVIHWLPADADNVEVEIMMPDKTVQKGIAEKGISEMEEGDVIQFERFGFCRLDDKEKNSFWFTH